MSPLQPLPKHCQVLRSAESSSSNEELQQARPSSPHIPAHQGMITEPVSTPAVSLVVVALLLSVGARLLLVATPLLVAAAPLLLLIALLLVVAALLLSVAVPPLCLTAHLLSAGVPPLAVVSGPVVVSGVQSVAAGGLPLTAMSSVRQQEGSLACSLSFPSCSSSVAPTSLVSPSAATTLLDDWEYKRGRLHSQYRTDPALSLATRFHLFQGLERHCS